MDRRTFFDARAPFRAREGRRYYHELLKRYYRFLVPPGAHVLEVGCGLGDLLSAVEPARGVGIDFSPTIVELARQRHPELEFQLADALDVGSASYTRASPAMRRATSSPALGMNRRVPRREAI